MAGGAPSSTSTVTSTVPEAFRPYQDAIWQYGMNQIGQMSPEDTQSPFGDISPQNQTQLTAQAMQTGRALSGSPLESGGAGYAYDQLNGGGANPYATMANPYAGQSPFLQQMIDQSNGAITHGYQTGTAAQTDARASRMGQYGSSQYNQQVQDNQGSLAHALYANTNQLLGADYSAQQGLAENALNRATGAFDQQGNRNNQILGMLPQFQQMDYNNINQMQQAGNSQYAYQQSLLDSLNNNWNNWNNFGLNQTDRFGALLHNILGSGGQSTTVSHAPSANLGGAAAGLGAGLLGGLMG